MQPAKNPRLNHNYRYSGIHPTKENDGLIALRGKIKTDYDGEKAEEREIKAQRGRENLFIIEIHRVVDVSRRLAYNLQKKERSTM